MSGLYGITKSEILKGGLNLSSADLRAILVTALYTPNFTTHDFLNDVPVNARASAEAVLLTSPIITVVNGKAVFDASDMTFPSVPDNAPIVGVVVYVHNASEAAARLFGYFNDFANFPLTPDGRDTIITWANTENRIFSW